MASSWYIRQPPQVYNSGFERQEFFNNASDGLDEIFDESFLGSKITLYQNGILDEETAIHTTANVWGNTPVREHFFTIRHLITRQGHAKLGNYVKYQDLIWLITEPPGDNGWYSHAWMVLCNYNIRWVSDGKVVEYPCSYGDETRFSPGETESRELVVPNAQLLMALPKNSDTVKLKRGMRFIIDDYDRAINDVPMVFKITKPVATQKTKGNEYLYKFNMLESSFDSTTDSIEHWCADYWRRVNIYTLELAGSDFRQVLKDESLQLNVVAKIDNVQTTEDIVFESSDETIATVSSSGLVTGLKEGKVKITATFGEAAPVSVIICVVDNISKFQSYARISFSGLAEIRSGSTKIFTSEFFGTDGLPISDIVPTWNYYLEDGTKPSWIKVQSQSGMQIQLHCDSNISLIGMKFYLRATDSGVISDTIEVSVISLT